MKTCPRCDSDNVVRVLTSSMILTVPELRKEVKEGRAIVCTACCGTGSSRTFRCKICILCGESDNLVKYQGKEL